MIIEEIRQIKTGKSDLRKFGVTIGIVLALFGALLWWRDKDYYGILLCFAAAFVLFGMLLPSLLKPIYTVWMIFSIILGWVMTRVILIILFYLVFTPIGIIGRLFGKRFLDITMNASQTSYWIYREARKPDKSTYEKQF